MIVLHDNQALMANSQCRGYFSIPRPSISEVLGLGGDGKKTPRHTESDFSDTALKTSGSINLKVQVFPLLWKGQFTAALGHRQQCLYLAHNSLSLHQPCSSSNQNISTVSMYLSHRILAAWRKHIRLVITCHLVWFLEWKLGGSVPLFQVCLAPSSWISPWLVPALCFSTPTLFPPPPIFVYITSGLPLPILSLIKTLEITHFPHISSFHPGYIEHLLCIRNCAKCWGS